MFKKALFSKATVSFQPFSKHLLVTIICLSLVLINPGSLSLIYAQSSYEAALARLDVYMSLLEQIQDTLDQTQFDLSALSLELAFEEPETVIAFVKNEIYFEQYEGMLRGAEGTLMSRAGNALDQALLLESLLLDGGAETRIARGILTDEQALLLVRQMAKPKPAAPAIGELAAIKSLFGELADLTDYGNDNVLALLEQALEPKETLPSELIQEANEVTDRLVSTLKQAGLRPGGMDVEQTLLSEAKDYFWLEYRFGPSDDWQAAHPATQFDVDIEASEYLIEGIPETLQHRLRVEVSIEQLNEGTTSTKAVMQAFEKPIADLTGELLSYVNAPDGVVAETSSSSLAEVVAETNYFLPMFNESLAEGGQAFDLSGELVSHDIAFESVANLGQSAGGMFGGFGGSTTSEEAERATVLSAQWIDYTLISPDGKASSYQRMMFDLIGAENRAQSFNELTKASSPLDLLAQQRFMIAAIDYPVGYLLDQLIARILETRPLLEFVTQQLYESSKDINLDGITVSNSKLEHLYTYHMFDALLETQILTSYRAEPSLVVYSDGFREANGETLGFSSIDIVNNSRRVLKQQNDQLANTFEETMRVGVWETIIEREFMSGNQQGSVDNVFRSFDAADQNNIPVRVFEPNQKDEIAQLSLSAEAKSNLQKDLERGFTVIVPEAVPDENTAWWRVNLATGETLGITQDGRGQTSWEWVMNVYDKTFTVAFSLKSFLDCANEATPVARACCLIKAYIDSAVGFGVGTGLGAMYGVAFGSTVGAMMGLGVTMTSGIFSASFGGEAVSKATCQYLNPFRNK